MKILVIGGSGVIGSHIVQSCLKQKINVEFTFLRHPIELESTRHNLNVSRRTDVLSLVTRVEPDIVIHTVAVTNVDLCETDKALASSINVDGTANVVNACKKIGSKIIYISTASVFDGKKEEYHEFDRPNPNTNYGFTKLQGEELVRDSGIPSLILRTDQPYCWIEKGQHINSVLRVLDKLSRCESFDEVTDWYNTPTYVPDFVNTMFTLINNDAEGTFHLVGSDFIDRFNWSLQVAETFRLDKKLIRPIHSDRLGLPVKRSNIHLSNDKVFNQTGIRMIGTWEGLIRMISKVEY